MSVSKKRIRKKNSVSGWYHFDPTVAYEEGGGAIIRNYKHPGGGTPSLTGGNTLHGIDPKFEAPKIDSQMDLLLCKWDFTFKILSNFFYKNVS